MKRFAAVSLIGKEIYYVLFHKQIYTGKNSSIKWFPLSSPLTILRTLQMSPFKEGIDKEASVNVHGDKTGHVNI